MFLYSDCCLSSNWPVVTAFVTAIITYNTTVTEPYYSIDQYPPPTRRRGGTTATKPYYFIDQYPHQHDLS